MADGTKVALYACLGVAVLGGASHYWLTKEREKADKDQKRALIMLKTISEHAADIAVLEQEKDADDWVQKSASNRQHEVFAKAATDAGLPGPSVGNKKDTTPSGTPGFTDWTYELSWTYQRNGQKGFDRERIAQYLWRLENRPLLKVTDLRLAATDDTAWDDLWDPRVNVTERKPLTVKADS